MHDYHRTIILIHEREMETVELKNNNHKIKLQNPTTNINKINAIIWLSNLLIVG